ncbi:MAG: hypothetical protein FWF29_06110 [Treponema sp.]|nr:hypothetical protein [Treponema sp.]
MNKRFIIAGLLLLAISLTVYSQVVLIGGDNDGPKFSLTGTATGMFTAGFMDQSQVAARRQFEGGSGVIGLGPAPGVYYGEELDKVGPGKNGYFTQMDYRMIFNPVPSVELYVKFLALYRPGSPYLPLQSEEVATKTFSDFSVDSAFGRVNAVKGLGFTDSPLDIWLKAEKFDTLPSQYYRVTRHSSERATVMGSLRTTNQYSMQIEAAYAVPGTKRVSLALTTDTKLNDAIPILLDNDETISGTQVWHGDPKTTADFPLHAALKLDQLELPIGVLSAEFIYAYNAMFVYSGNNYGLDAGLNIPVNDQLTVPVGIAAALYGKNIDPLAAGGLDGISNYFSLYELNGYHYDSTTNKSWDSATVSFRQALRFGVEAGAKYAVTPDINTELNLSFILSQIAHYYRDTLTLPSLTADIRATYQDRYFVGGALFLGTLSDTVWKTKTSVDPSIDDFNHAFKVAQNMGFEVFGGLQLSKAKFVLGYNINKGLSMNDCVETIPEAQIKYRQKDTSFADGLFERGGFFTKLSISW